MTHEVPSVAKRGTLRTLPITAPIWFSGRSNRKRIDVSACDVFEDFCRLFFCAGSSASTSVEHETVIGPSERQ